MSEQDTPRPLSVPAQEPPSTAIEAIRAWAEDDANATIVDGQAFVSRFDLLVRLPAEASGSATQPVLWTREPVCPHCGEAISDSPDEDFHPYGTMQAECEHCHKLVTVTGKTLYIAATLPAAALPPRPSALRNSDKLSGTLDTGNAEAPLTKPTE